MIACRYALLQFMPYSETGEFANVGVVLACPSTGFLGFRLETRKYARYTAFFTSLDKHIYLQSVAAMRDELKRLVAIAGERPSRTADIFASLIHPREAILRFGNDRAILTDNPEVEIDRLFARYVEHDFVKQENYEAIMINRVKLLLQTLNLVQPFREEQIGDSEYHARFPLVQCVNQRPSKAIKPFFLGQPTTTELLEHGDRWLSKLKRLKERDLLPNKVLFTVEGPAREDANRWQAYQEICSDLQRHVQVLEPSARLDEEIRNFAIS